MFKIIVPKATFKELEKIDAQNQKLIFEKIKDLEAGNFSNLQRCDVCQKVPAAEKIPCHHYGKTYIFLTATKII